MTETIFWGAIALPTVALTAVNLFMADRYGKLVDYLHGVIEKQRKADDAMCAEVVRYTGVISDKVSLMADLTARHAKAIEVAEGAAEAYQTLAGALDALRVAVVENGKLAGCVHDMGPVLQQAMETNNRVADALNEAVQYYSGVKKLLTVKGRR